jgi:hypothetical protein
MNRPNKKLCAIQSQIHDDAYDILTTCEQFELSEQPDAAEKLESIAVMARELSTTLNDLCNCESFRETEARERAETGGGAV